MKDQKIQKVATRRPHQARALYKIELILEAAMRLLDKGGMALLTTNAVAEAAGVSIGTLYQYFPNKTAILDALAEQELVALSARVLAVLQDTAAAAPQLRIGRIVNAVTAGYGQRRRVQKLVLEHSLAVHGGKRIAPLVQQIMALLTERKRPAAETAMSEAEAFVITNAFVGVMRAMIVRPDTSKPAQQEIEDAMGRLFTNFIRHAGSPA